jgi:hypothetical protein
MHLNTILDRIGSWMNRHWVACGMIWSAVFWFTMIVRASHEPFIFDEVVSWRVARLPSIAAVWDALMRGFDQELPLTHILVRASHSLLGPTHFATRLPGALGFFLLMWCLYILLIRRLPVPYAMTGMLLPVVTEAWGFAYQARAYGIMMGAGALAVLSWDTAANEPRWRKLALAGITVGLLIALSTHMMAVMLGLPLAVGEILRSIDRRRIDIPVWIAFALSIPAIVIYPVVLSAAAGLDISGMYPRPEAIAGFYSGLLKPAVFPLLGAFLLVYLAGREKDLPDMVRLPRYLSGALIACAALPAIFITIAFAIKHFFFVPRYGMLAIIGLAALIATATAWACRASLRSGAAIVLVVAAWIGVTRVGPALKRSSPDVAFAGEFPLLKEAIRLELPVVVSDPSAFLLSGFYYSESDAKLLHYVTDIKNAANHSDAAINQEILHRMQQTMPLGGSVIPYEEFVRTNRRFVVYIEDERPPEWLFAALLKRGCTVTLRTQAGGESLVTVDATPGL